MSNTTFWCPECESHHFGSSGIGPEGPKIGRCHGCGHEWDRSQDYVYFVKVQRFRTPREYERHMNGTDRITLVSFAIGFGLAFFALAAATVHFWLRCAP